jgi:hypothetical protein
LICCAKSAPAYLLFYICRGFAITSLGFLASDKLETNLHVTKSKRVSESEDKAKKSEKDDLTKVVCGNITNHSKA